MRFVVQIPFVIYAFVAGTAILVAGTIGLFFICAAATLAYLVFLFKKPAETVAGTLLVLALALAARFPVVGIPVALALLVCLAIGARTASSTELAGEEMTTEGKRLDAQRRSELEAAALASIADKRAAIRQELADQRFEGYEQFETKR
jgi:hypothetical protein